MTTTLLPGILGRRPQRRTRQPRRRPVRDRHRGPAPPRRRPVLGVDRRPTDDEWADLNKAVPDQPLHLAVVLSGVTRDCRAGGARAGGRWADAIDAVRERRRRARASPRGPPRRVAPPGTPAAAPGRRRRRRLGHAGELHPKVCRLRGARPHRGRGDRPRRADGSARWRRAADRTSRPTRSPRRTSRSWSTPSVPAADVEAALREGAGELLESIRLFDVYTGDQVGRGKSRWPSRCGSAPPTAP